MILKPRHHISVASIALFLGGLLWIAAFWLPVFETEQRTIAGYWIFLTGWMGFVVFQFAWYANLLLLIAVILMYSEPLKATLSAALGLLIATQAFWFDVLPETTKSIEIIDRGPGFWLWYAGIFLLSIGVFFCSDKDEVTEVTEVPGTEVEPPENTVLVTDVAVETPENTAVTAAAPESLPANPDDEVKTEQHEEKEPVVPVPGAPDAKPATPEAGNKANISLVAQLEAVRKSKQKVLMQQEKAKVLSAEELGKKQALDEHIEKTLPVTQAIINDALFSGTKKAGS